MRQGKDIPFQMIGYVTSPSKFDIYTSKLAPPLPWIAKIFLLILWGRKWGIYSINRVFILFCLPGAHTGGLVLNTLYSIKMVDVVVFLMFRIINLPAMLMYIFLYGSSTSRYNNNLFSNFIFEYSCYFLAAKPPAE